MFSYNGSAWVQLGSDIDGEAADDNFGGKISLSSSGNRIAIGGRFNDGNGSNSGHVRVFKWDDSSWSQIQNDINGEDSDNSFGSSISLMLLATYSQLEPLIMMVMVPILATFEYLNCNHQQIYRI